MANPAPRPASPDGSSSPAVLRGLCLLTAVFGLTHLALAGVLEPAPDEAWYWTWGKDLASTYPDHPPLVGWLAGLSTALFGDSALALRLPAVLLGTALLPLLFALARAAGVRPATALGVTLLAALSPLPSAAAFLLTPDTPLVFGWALALLGLLRLDAGRSGPGATLPVALGTAVAAASKLTGLLLPLAAALWLRGRPRSARTAAAALGVGLVAVLPLYVIDLAAGGATRFQLAHGLVPPPAGPFERLLWPAAFLGAQAALLGAALPAVAAFFRSRHGLGSAAALLVPAAALPWALFLAASLLAPSEPNWPAPAHLAALAGAGLAYDRARRRDAAWTRRGPLFAAFALQGTAALALHLALALPVGPAARLHGWEALARDLAADGRPAGTADYGVAAELRFHGYPDRLGRDGCPDGAATCLWVVPEAGGRLPGASAPAGVPAGCTALDGGGGEPVVPARRSGAAMPKRLRHPVAPVRVIPVRCPDVAPSPRVW